jgi:Bor protein
MTARHWIFACVLACVLSGCFRTVYRNLEPPGTTPAPRAAVRRSPAWRSFFLYGWVPRELVVHAAVECGGARNVREIRTRRTFGQSLVASFASSSGVNIYSPWTGEVVCGTGPMLSAAADPPRAGPGDPSNETNECGLR